MPSPPWLSLPPMSLPLSTMYSVLPSLSTLITPTVGSSRHQSPSPSKARSRALNYNGSDLELLLLCAMSYRLELMKGQSSPSDSTSSGAAGMYRNQYSLQTKFNKLDNIKKNTGNPSFRPKCAQLNKSLEILWEERTQKLSMTLWKKMLNR